MRSMTPVEMAAVFAVGGSVLAVAAPTFIRDLHASRTSEAIDGIHRIAARSVALSEGREIAASFPQPAPLTPAEIPRGRPVTDPPGTWDHPTWKELEFSFSNAHYYAFQYNVSTEPTRIWFQAIAQGDLNGDGVTSTFIVEGERRPGQNAVVLPGLHVNREVE